MTRCLLGRASGLVLAGCLSVAPVKASGQKQQLTAVEPATMPVAARSKALATLLDAIWQDRLKHSPEFASSIGDKRYNDQLTDYSVKEVNAALGRGSEYIQRLS